MGQRFDTASFVDTSSGDGVSNCIGNGAAIRLQKVLSAAGVCSRRKAEILIDRGRVKVNGKLISRQGVRINPDKDVVSVDNSIVYTKLRKVLYAFNKPKGVLSTMHSKNNRATISDFIPKHILDKGVFHVGRLDLDTSGLMLITNDGDFAQEVLHPSKKIQKVYVVLIKGILSSKELNMLKEGVTLKDGLSKFDSIKILDSAGSKTLVQVKIHSGKNRIIRRTFEATGHKVLELTRIQVGKIILGNLKPGKLRKLEIGRSSVAV